ncbi:hypothetical protein C2G38_2038636 [Gigaspora rosea]|uniref:Serine-threonine/tyrosine-protein kinase catalytic domain-containing protein n=1 Tax=Gigaspora rosea TaxID=44941 RepID=A0A397V8Q3_9GLOM|nr:hypothetical protein C2G38_2038636 [Gigaspora rosea]
MWEIDACRLPFNCRKDQDLTRELCLGARETPVDGMPISYKDIFEKCWGDNPSYRYAEISDILEVLDNIEQTPIYSEESKDKSPGSPNQMDIETIITSPSNVEPDTIKGIELFTSFPDFLII